MRAPTGRLESLVARLDELPCGFSRGRYAHRLYGTTITVSPDGRRLSLYAAELGGNDIVSFNLYKLDDGTSRLMPCEMPADKVIDFVLGYAPDPSGR